MERKVKRKRGKTMKEGANHILDLTKRLHEITSKLTQLQNESHALIEEGEKIAKELQELGAIKNE